MVIKIFYYVMKGDKVSNRVIEKVEMKFKNEKDKIDYIDKLNDTKTRK